MPWITVQTRDDIYMYNEAGLNQVFRAWARAQAMLTHSEVTAEKAGWFAPTLHNVNVDFAKVRAATDAGAKGQWKQLAANKEAPFTVIRGVVADLLGRTDRFTTDYELRVKKAQARTMANIESTVSGLENAETALKVVRDLSAEFLLASATVATAGAATPLVIAAGAGMKAAAKYQDTPGPNAGKAATAEFVSSAAFAFVGLKIGVKASGVDAVALNIVASKVQAITDTGRAAWLEGTDIKEAVLTGTAKSMLAAPVEGAKGAVSPKNLAAMTKEAVGRQGVAALAVATIMVAGDRLAAAGGKAGSAPVAPAPTPVQPKAARIDPVRPTDEFIEKCVLRRSGTARSGLTLP